MLPAFKPSAISSLFLLATCLLLATATAAPPRHGSRKLLTIDAAQSTQSTDGIVGDIVDYFSGGGSSSSGGGRHRCIECRDCSTDHCFSVCQQSCSGNLPPIQPIVDGDSCKAYGSQAGTNAASSACQTAKLYCNGGSQPFGALGAFPVTLSQCQNIAFGVCQQTASSAWSSPCGWEMTWGYKSCSASQFNQFYNGEIDSLCKQQVQAIAP